MIRETFKQQELLMAIVFRYSTLIVLWIFLAVMWTADSPYLHDFGEWVYQSKILTLQWTQPGEVTGFQWAAYPVPNVLAILIMAVLGLLFPAITAAKIFLSLLLAGWYFALRVFVEPFGNRIDSAALLFLLFSLAGLSNFFWTGFVSYQLALLLLTLFLIRFKPTMPGTEMALFAVLIFLSHAMIFLVFVMLVLLEMKNFSKRGRWVVALTPAAVLSFWFVLGRLLTDYTSPVAGATMAGWQETVIYKLGFPLMLGPFKNFLQPDMSSLVDQLPWVYWAGFCANVFVITGIGVLVLFVILKNGRSSIMGDADNAGLAHQTLRIAAWTLLLFYLLAPYNFYGLINPSGRVAIPLLLVCLLMLRGTADRVFLSRVLRILTPLTLVFTFYTLFTYMILMHKSGDPGYLAGRPVPKGKPPSGSVLEYNTWLYSQARYNYFNYRIFAFSDRFEDIRLKRFSRLGFRTALLVDFKEPQ